MVLPVKVRFVSRCRFLLLENNLLSKYSVNPPDTHIWPTNNFLNF